jgi:hypothetical protein
MAGSKLRIFSRTENIYEEYDKVHTAELEKCKRVRFEQDVVVSEESATKTKAVAKGKKKVPKADRVNNNVSDHEEAGMDLPQSKLEEDFSK